MPYFRINNCSSVEILMWLGFSAISGGLSSRSQQAHQSLHSEKMGLEDIPVEAWVLRQLWQPRSDPFCLLSSVQRAVGVEQAEGSRELLLVLWPCQANLREAQSAGRLLSVFTGAPTQEGELF